jgi:hypothetical protein
MCDLAPNGDHVDSIENGDAWDWLMTQRAMDLYDPYEG